jgi:hypothetical protein
VAAEITKENLKEELAVLENNRDTMRATLHHAKENLRQQQAHYDRLQGMFNAECGDTTNWLGNRISRRFAQKECEGHFGNARPNYWVPINGRCGTVLYPHDRETGNTKDADWDNNQNLCVADDGSSINQPVDVGKWTYSVMEASVPCLKTIGKVYELVQDPFSPKNQCDVVTRQVRNNTGWDATWVQLGPGYCLDPGRTVVSVAKSCAKYRIVGQIRKSFPDASWCKTFFKNDYVRCASWNPVRVGVGLAFLAGELALEIHDRASCPAPKVVTSRSELCSVTNGRILQSVTQLNNLLQELANQVAELAREVKDLEKAYKEKEKELEQAEKNYEEADMALKVCMSKYEKPEQVPFTDPQCP